MSPPRQARRRAGSQLRHRRKARSASCHIMSTNST
jgi:hypothetical protein